MRKAITVKFKCPDDVARDFLLDTGAAASLVSHSLFRKVCTKLGLRPSRLRLHAANAGNMASKGNADIDTAPLISHVFEVLKEGGTPVRLQIAGVHIQRQRILDAIQHWR